MYLSLSLSLTHTHPYIEGDSRKNFKKWKTKKHLGSLSSGRYAFVHTNKLSCFLFLMHMRVIHMLKLLVCANAFRLDERLPECSSIFHFLRFFIEFDPSGQMG